MLEDFYGEVFPYLCLDHDQSSSGTEKITEIFGNWQEPETQLIQNIRNIDISIRAIEIKTKRKAGSGRVPDIGSRQSSLRTIHVFGICFQ